jgi:hypothetical protein
MEIPRRMGLSGVLGLRGRRRERGNDDLTGAMTRDEAIQAGIFALAGWHLQDHGDRCRCLEGEKFGFQAAAVIDALAAEGMQFDGYTGTGRPGSLGASAMEKEQ